MRRFAFRRLDGARTTRIPAVSAQRTLSRHSSSVTSNGALKDLRILDLSRVLAVSLRGVLGFLSD
jgi:hypothetical protein